MTAIAQHSSSTNEHYTPGAVVEAARAVMGGFDIDPASCAEANATIRATRIYTAADDGLVQPWQGRAFLNPPGGVLRNVDGRWIVPPKRSPHEDKSSAWVWWDELVRRYEAGAVTQAIFVGFTLEILRTSQASRFPVQTFPRCYPADRLRFGGNAPTHGNVVVYLPPDADVASWHSFAAAFGPLGLCERGAWEGR